MRRFAGLALLPLLVSGCFGTPPPASVVAVPSETVGILPGETTWRGEILMTGDVLIPAGSSLTILPGTTVRIRAAEGTKIDPEYLSSATELLIRGSLRVLGTLGEPVRFVPEKPEVGSEAVWAGIELDGAETSEVWGAEILRAESGLLIIGGSPVVVANRISASRYGIIVQAGGAPQILDNLISDGEGGVFLWSGARPYLKGNTIRGHQEEGIFVATGCRPYLDRNTVTGNDIGVAIAEGDLPVDRVGVSGNRVDLLHLFGQGRRP